MLPPAQPAGEATGPEAEVGREVAVAGTGNAWMHPDSGPGSGRSDHSDRAATVAGRESSEAMFGLRRSPCCPSSRCTVTR